MGSSETENDFSSLYEFLLHHKVKDMSLLRNTMCTNIVIQKKCSSSTANLPSNTLSPWFVSKEWSCFTKTQLFKDCLYSLPLYLLQSLSEYNILLKTSSNALIRLSDPPTIKSSEFGLMSGKSMIVSHINILTAQNALLSRTIGSKIEKLLRLKGSKQVDYLFKILSQSKELVSSEKEVQVLVQVFSVILKNLKTLNPSAVLPKECHIEKQEFDSLEHLIERCRTDNKIICRFLSNLIIILIPLIDIFGSCKFRRVFIKELMKLIRNCPKYDSKFLHNLPFVHLADARLGVFVNKPRVIVNVLYFLITEIMFPLLKQQYYTCKEKKGLTFYNKLMWLKVQDKGFAQLSPYFSEVEQNILEDLQLSEQLFGIYTIRIQPKTNNGFRLISLLNRTVPCGINVNMPVNSKLVPTAAILKAIHRDSDFSCPYPIKGKIDLGKKIASYKNEVLVTNQNGKLPDLYFFKCDAQSCYDNIDLKVLRSEALHWINWTPFYHVLKLKKYCHVTHCTRTKNIAIPSQQKETLSFLEIVREIESTSRNCTVTLLKYRVYSKEFAKKNVRNFLLNSLLYHNGKFYQRVKGMPQGAKIAKHLCDFYFCYLFRDAFIGPDSLFLSATDDFLLVSTDKSEVDCFMKDCLEERYAFILNKQKTVSYVDKVESLEYYGLKINIINLTYSSLS